MGAGFFLDVMPKVTVGPYEMVICTINHTKLMDDASVLYVLYDISHKSARCYRLNGAFERYFIQTLQNKSPHMPHLCEFSYKMHAFYTDWTE